MGIDSRYLSCKMNHSGEALSSQTQHHVQQPRPKPTRGIRGGLAIDVNN